LLKGSALISFQDRRFFASRQTANSVSGSALLSGSAARPGTNVDGRPYSKKITSSSH
jgi:hypothetical protein